MARSRGRQGVDRYIAQVPEALEKRILRGAANAATSVVADEARDRCISSEVREAIDTTVRTEPGRVVGKVQVKGKGAFKAPWLEYGTDPHFITIDETLSEGRSARRVNKLARDGVIEPEGSLMIDGKPVGTSVHHPGAQAHPFLRPALDTKEAAAVAAAQSYINTRLARTGLAATSDDGDDA